MLFLDIFVLPYSKKQGLNTKIVSALKLVTMSQIKLALITPASETINALQLTSFRSEEGIMTSLVISLRKLFGTGKRDCSTRMFAFRFHLLWNVFPLYLKEWQSERFSTYFFQKKLLKQRYFWCLPSCMWKMASLIFFQFFKCWKFKCRPVCLKIITIRIWFWILKKTCIFVSFWTKMSKNTA